MATISSLNSNQANLTVLEAFVSGYKQYQQKMPQLFNRVTPKRKDEIFAVLNSGGDIPEVAEGAAFPSVDVKEVGTKTLSQKEYKSKISITKLMQRFDNYGAVAKEAQMLGHRASISIDKLGANIFNNSTSTTAPYGVWDGLALASTVHLIGDTGSTQSNIVSGALNKSNLNSAIVALTNQKNHNNQPDPLPARVLLVPPAMSMTAWELVYSKGSPENANRNDNYINSKSLQVVEWELLTDTADCFLLSDKMFHKLFYIPAIEPTIEYVRDDDTGNMEWQLQYDVVVGAADYRGVIKIDG